MLEKLLKISVFSVAMKRQRHEEYTTITDAIEVGIFDGGRRTAQKLSQSSAHVGNFTIFYKNSKSMHVDLVFLKIEKHPFEN